MEEADFVIQDGKFIFKPADWVPFKDREVIERLRKMTPEELVKHPNPDVNIRILENFGAVVLAEKFMGIRDSYLNNKKFSTIFGNPNPIPHMALAEMINRNKIDCKNCVFVTMDEWADEDGNIAPPTYQSGFTYSFLKYFINKIDPKLRPKPENILYPTTENINYYSDMIDDKTDGGIDYFTSGPGWAGHVAFIDPCPEYMNVADMEEYMQQPAKVVTLHPLTIAQNSLHGVFGQSGDIASVPPKAATIGPRDVLHGKVRVEGHGLTTSGAFSSWQRMTSRLITHGPVTPAVPGSMYQLLPCTIFLSPAIAKPIECMETVGY
jgi:6-phosphogluconolactonase/glucosamine-6-phosphate isomerase/deaminase